MPDLFDSWRWDVVISKRGNPFQDILVVLQNKQEGIDGVHAARTVSRATRGKKSLMAPCWQAPAGDQCALCLPRSPAPRSWLFFNRGNVFHPLALLISFAPT